MRNENKEKIFIGFLIVAIVASIIVFSISLNSYITSVNYYNSINVVTDFKETEDYSNYFNEQKEYLGAYYEKAILNIIVPIISALITAISTISLGVKSNKIKKETAADLDQELYNEYKKVKNSKNKFIYKNVLIIEILLLFSFVISTIFIGQDNFAKCCAGIGLVNTKQEQILKNYEEEQKQRKIEEERQALDKINSITFEINCQFFDKYTYNEITEYYDVLSMAILESLQKEAKKKNYSNDLDYCEEQYNKYTSLANEVYQKEKTFENTLCSINYRKIASEYKLDPGNMYQIGVQFKDLGDLAQQNGQLEEANEAFISSVVTELITLQYIYTEVKFNFSTDSYNNLTNKTFNQIEIGLKCIIHSNERLSDYNLKAEFFLLLFSYDDYSEIFECNSINSDYSSIKERFIDETEKLRKQNIELSTK